MHGGDCAAVQLRPGDTVSITDPEGLQPAHLFVFDGTGAPAPASLGLSGLPEGLALADVLATSGEQGRAAARRAEAAGLSKAATARVLFAEGDRPGQSARFTAPTDLLVFVAAAGPLMAPDEQAPPTDLEVEVTRAAGAPDLPPPLGAARSGLRPRSDPAHPAPA